MTVHDIMMMSREELTCLRLQHIKCEVLVDGKWQKPVRINDERISSGLLVYLLSSGKLGVALTGEYRAI